MPKSGGLVPRNPATPKLAVTVRVLVSKVNFLASNCLRIRSTAVFVPSPVRVGHQYEEFLPSETSADVGLACMCLENPREGLKHSIACIVPVGVVDLLERI